MLEKIVNAGEILVTHEECFISTSVYRNVVVILWNNRSSACGVCNFVAPGVYNRKLATAQFGNVALLKLLKMMKMKFGLHYTEAYLFGGASVDINDIIGEENVRMARKVLKSHLVHIASESISGKLQRNITFNTKNGECVIMKAEKH